ncbi:MAG TPA: RIP metalloprotease RseP [Bryobacteraceae bacterium]|nr:RIP metalloprotease RseP [Bryobacteraceae bacterium]
MLIVENILWLLVLIGVMIMIHELGHFWAARYFDVKVEAFSFGFGPRLFGFRRGETDYRFSLILFGGYVKMAGEQVTDENTDDPRSFLAKPRWQRLIIAFAGPFMNVVLAVAVLTGLFMVKYERPSDADMLAVIGHVLPDSPAAKAGIQDGDRIVKLDGQKNPTWEDIGMKEVSSAYRPMYLTVERNGRRFDTVVTPILSERLGFGYAGWDGRGEVQLGAIEPGYPAEKAGLQKGDVLIAVNGQAIHSVYKFQEMTKNSAGKPLEIEYNRKGQVHTSTVQPVYAKLDGPARWMIGVAPQQKLHLITTRLSLPEALSESIRQNTRGAMLIGSFLEGVVQRRMSPKTISGPIVIAQLSGEAARQGPSAFFLLMSMVSLNLAIFNLLPIPILDGGVIVMLLVEMIMQRDLSLSVKEAVLKLGFVFILMIVAFVIYNDISKILPPG